MINIDFAKIRLGAWKKFQKTGATSLLCAIVELGFVMAIIGVPVQGHSDTYPGMFLNSGSLLQKHTAYNPEFVAMLWTFMLLIAVSFSITLLDLTAPSLLHKVGINFTTSQSIGFRLLLMLFCIEAILYFFGFQPIMYFLLRPSR